MSDELARLREERSDLAENMGLEPDATASEMYVRAGYLVGRDARCDEMEAEVERLTKGNAALRQSVGLKSGDYWLTSLGDGRGPAMVTNEGRLLVQQFGDLTWSDATHLYELATSWKIEPRAEKADAEVGRLTKAHLDPVESLARVVASVTPCSCSAQRARAEAAEDALASIEALAKVAAIGERARGDSDRERDWLDVIAIIERQSTPKEHP